MTTSPGPLSRVMTAVADGARTRAEVAVRTGLDRDVLDAAIDHLLRLGWFAAEPMGGGCPATGCAGCPSGRADGAAGCGAANTVSAGGPVALRLTGRAESARADVGKAPSSAVNSVSRRTVG